MGRRPCYDGSDLKKGPWSPEEDQKLITHIQNHGHSNWSALSKLAGLNRGGKSCRLRWTNYLRPDIKRGKFTQEEEQTILNLHSVLGNKWSAIARQLPGRTDNEVKNFWNTHLKKKLIQMGFDPMTHRPRTDILSSSTLTHIIALANLKLLMHKDNPNPSMWPEEHAIMKFHTETLHYIIQYLLLQPPYSSLTNINNNDNHNEIEIMNLINFLSPQNNNNNNVLQVPLGTDSVGHHLPSLEIMIPNYNNTNTDETAAFIADPNYVMNNEGGACSNHKCGDECSSSSFMGSTSASIWSDQLLHQHPNFFHHHTDPSPHHPIWALE